jgi:hypothetical protein
MMNAAMASAAGQYPGMFPTPYGFSTS